VFKVSWKVRFDTANDLQSLLVAVKSKYHPSNAARMLRTMHVMNCWLPDVFWSQHLVTDTKSTGWTPVCLVDMNDTPAEGVCLYRADSSINRQP